MTIEKLSYFLSVCVASRDIFNRLTEVCLLKIEIIADTDYINILKSFNLKVFCPTFDPTRSMSNTVTE